MLQMLSSSESNVIEYYSALISIIFVQPLQGWVVVSASVILLFDPFGVA